MIYWRYNIFLVLVGGLCVMPAIALAEGFVQLVGLPSVTGSAVTNTNSYINTLYELAIAAAGLLAVLKLISAGVQYSLSDIVTSKESAKQDIRGAIIGLLVVLAAVLILNTINRNLTTFNLFENVNTPLSGQGNPIAPTAPTAVSGGRGADAVVQNCPNQSDVKTSGSGRNKRTVCCTNNTTDVLCRPPSEPTAPEPTLQEQGLVSNDLACAVSQRDGAVISCDQAITTCKNQSGYERYEVTGNTVRCLIRQ